MPHSPVCRRFFRVVPGATRRRLLQGSAGLALVALAGCATPTGGVGTPAAALPEPKRGLTLTGSEHGRSTIWRVEQTDPATMLWISNRGCHRRTLHDPFSPRLRWQGCGSGPWSAGQTRVRRVNGSLWPLQVGNQSSYDLEVRTTNGDWHPITRRCEVVTRGPFTVPAGTFDAFQVACLDNFRTWNWAYAPKLGTIIAQKEAERRTGRVLEEWALTQR